MIPITIAVIGGQATGDQSAGRKPLTAFFPFTDLRPGHIHRIFCDGCGSRFYRVIVWYSLQSPWVIGFVVAVFVGLALSMFGCTTCEYRLLSQIGWELEREGDYRGFCHGLGFRDSRITCIGPALASLFSLYRQHRE